MKPPAFDYVRVDSLAEAVALLAAHGDEAKVLAGGQSLMPLLNLRLVAPQVLVDITQARDLDYARLTNGWLEIGAAATQASVERRPALEREVPLLSQALPHVSHRPIRSRGTVCGSMAHADPSAELPLCLAALGGEVVLRASSGTRVVTADEFFLGMFTTARQPDEIVEAVRFPLRRPDTRYAFGEIAMRHGDFAIVALAAVVAEDVVALAVGGVADRPVVRRWPCLAGGDLDAVLNDFAWELEARDDRQASAAYRRHLVRTLGRRLIAEAA